MPIQKESSETKTKKDNEFKRKNLGHFFTQETIQHIFLTDLSYQETLQKMEEKGIKFQPLRKEEESLKLENDPEYHYARGNYRNWLVEISSYTVIASQKLDRTTLIFSRSVEVGR